MTGVDHNVDMAMTASTSALWEKKQTDSMVGTAGTLGVRRSGTGDRS